MYISKKELNRIRSLVKEADEIISKQRSIIRRQLALIEKLNAALSADIDFPNTERKEVYTDSNIR